MMISEDELKQWESEAAPFALLNDFNALRVIALINETRELRKKLIRVTSELVIAENQELLKKLEDPE